jgi:hypothetical protein
LADSTGLEVGPLSGLKLLQAISTGDLTGHSATPHFDLPSKQILKLTSKKSDNFKSNIRLLVGLPTFVEGTAWKSLRLEI